jgi:hypothetical protein
MADAWCADIAPQLIFAQEPIRITYHHAAASCVTLVLIIAVLATAGGLDVTWAAIDGASLETAATAGTLGRELSNGRRTTHGSTSPHS